MIVRLVIADDQALFREGLRTLLSTRPKVAVVGEAANGEEAIALVDELQPDVVLIAGISSIGASQPIGACCRDAIS